MFHSARLKLTALYLLIIMIISMMFSVVIYKVLSDEIERFEQTQRFRIERRIQESQPPDHRLQIPMINPELLEEYKHRILIELIVINLGILFISGGLGYVLAGKTLQPIKDMVEEQNRFISDASHELRTPLTSLKTAMEVYLRNKSPNLQEAKNLISENVIEVNKLQTLSEELLQLTQYQKSNNNLKFETFFLSEIIKESKHQMAAVAKQKLIKIKNNIEDHKIEGNKYGLTNLLVILLDNAIKYSPIKSTITIQSKKTDGSIIIQVIDEGIGISEKDLPHIFDRFYRADTARSKSKIDGYGLGLSIAKKIIQVHSGSIKVDSKVNKGTTFTIRLPLSVFS